MIDNQILFINDYSNDPLRFTPTYSDINYFVSSLNIIGNPFRNFEIEMVLKYQKPTTELENENYLDNPDIRLDTELSYDGLLNEKLTIGTRMFAGSKIDYINANIEDDKLDGFFDLGFFGKYRLNKKAHLFLDLNNITHSKYQRWNGYENVGFNTMIGFFYKFE